jgi:hypothetical protein
LLIKTSSKYACLPNVGNYPKRRNTGAFYWHGKFVLSHSHVLIGGMIEEKAAAEDPLAGFVVESVIEGQDQAPIDQISRKAVLFTFA